MNIQNLLPLPQGWDLGDVVVLMASIAVFFAVFALWNALLQRDPMAGRIQQLKTRRNQIQEQALGPRRRQERSLKAMSFMNRVVQRLNLMKSRHADQVTGRLAQAGIRTKDAVITYLFAKLCLPMAFGLLAAGWIFVVQPEIETAALKFAIPMGAVLLGMLAPDIFIRNAIQKRHKQLVLALPDTLDLMVVCAEAGLSLDAALNRVANEIGQANPELADELLLTSLELGFLPNRRQALENLTARTALPQIRSVVNTLLQSEKYGTPLAQSLRILSNEYRNERMLKAEDKAARLPATLTVPMILFILPALFVVLLVPAALRTMDGMSGASF